jgi:hypothetical protein
MSENIGNTVVHTMDDLKKLLLLGDEYREDITVDYLGQQFAVTIRPLNDLELTSVMRKMTSSKFLKKVMDKKRRLQKGTEFSEADKAKLADELLEEDGMVEMAHSSMQLMTEICKLGIVDEALGKLVVKGKWGIVQKIGQKIQAISNVPPEAISKFFQ